VNIEQQSALPSLIFELEDFPIVPMQISNDSCMCNYGGNTTWNGLGQPP